jgi:hypothetical protein
LAPHDETKNSSGNPNALLNRDLHSRWAAAAAGSLVVHEATKAKSEKSFGPNFLLYLLFFFWPLEIFFEGVKR